MLKIYAVWEFNPLLKKESIIAWDRDKNQAELKKKIILNNFNQIRVAEHLIDEDKIKEIRKVRLAMCEQMLANVKSVSKKINADSKDGLMIRADLVDRVEKAKERMKTPEGFIHDDEIERYLFYIQNGII